MRTLDRDNEPCVRCSATPNYVGDDVTGTWVSDGWCCPDCYPHLDNEED